MGNGSDFELPDEILTVLPTDPYDQLDLARKITSIAISSRVSKLEAENSRLRLKLSEKDHIIRDLEGKISHLDYALHESSDRLSKSIDEQLEAFKKTLMQSLQEDDEAPQSEATENTTAPRPAKSSFSSSLREDAVNGALSNQRGSETMETSSSIPEEENHAEYDASRHSGQRFSFTPYLTPRRTPTGTPNTKSAVGSPKISPVRSPRRHSTSGSPTKRQSEGRISSSLPPIYHATAPNSPPHKRSITARTPRVDGKEFFRQARNRLSLEQFSAFLANIKELNAHQQSRE
ncbi:hypothetical protein KI387_023889, partial [Taxus chinensis]